MRNRHAKNISLQSVHAAINSGHLIQARTLAKKMLRIAPNTPDILHANGVICLMLGDAAQAQRYIQRALALHENPTFYANLALAFQQLNLPDAAERAFRDCLRLQPDHAQASNNLGNILRNKFRYLEAEGIFRQAIVANPEHPLLYLNLGRVLVELRRSEEAIPVLQRALEISPGNSEVQISLAGALEQRKRYGDAAKHLRAAEHWTELQLVMRQTADWRELDEVDCKSMQQLGDSSSKCPGPWGLINMPLLTPELHRDAGRRFANHRWFTAMASEPLHDHIPQTDRLRIGYLSCDFFDHATMHLLMGILETHNQVSFDIHLFDHSPERDDQYTRRIRDTGLRRHDLRNLTDEEAAQLIVEQRIHVLVDLKGYTTGARLGICARRPAPVIVNWLGYPGSLGHPRLADYVIGDETVTPLEHSEHFSEKIALLPNSYQPNDRNRPVGGRQKRFSVGLPDSAVVFCSFNQILKLNPHELDIWCKVLAMVPDSVIWLLDPDSEETRANLLNEFAMRAIESSRVLFAPRLAQAEHLDRLGLADIALDSFPCNSHTTASDALWAGVPLVTRLGSTFASRVSGSLLRAVGLDELVARDEVEYINKLLELAKAEDVRQSLRARLVEARTTSPLFDTQRFAHDLEALYQAIWDDYSFGGAKGQIVRATHQ